MHRKKTYRDIIWWWIKPHVDNDSIRYKIPYYFLTVVSKILCQISLEMKRQNAYDVLYTLVD